jgi:CBS domain containing-hemolysin-like protein
MPPSAPLDPFPWLDVAIIVLLVMLNGVFAMSELAIVSSRRPRLRALAKAGRKGAQTALDLAADPGRFLSASLSSASSPALIRARAWADRSASASSRSGSNRSRPRASASPWSSSSPLMPR